VATLSGGLVGALVLIAVGSVYMSMRFNRQLHRAVDAEHAGKQHLWDSYLAGVRANRASKIAGQRFTSLEVLRKAVPLAAELNLDENATLTMRNEAIACLLLADLKLESHWHAGVSGVSALRVSFDGELTRYALASDSACIVRRVGTAADERRLPLERGPDESGTVERLTMSGDGRYLAAMTYSQDDSRVYLWDLDSPAPLPRTVDVEQPARFCFDSAATMLGIVQQSGKISIFDLATGAISAGGATSLTPAGCTFDQEGSRLAIWGGSSVEVVDVRKRNVVRQLAFPGDDQILCADFSPDGHWLAAGGSHHVVYLWHEDQPAPKFIMQGHQAWVTGVNFTPDGSLLASSSTDGTTRLWRSWTGTELVAIRGYGLRFSQDARRLAGLLGAGMSIYRVASEAERHTFRAAPSPSYEAITVEISPDGDLLATINAGGIQFWELDTGRQLAWLALPKLPWLRFRRQGNHNQLITGSEQGVQARTFRFDRASAHLEFGQPQTIELADEFRPVFDGKLSDNGGTLALLNGKGEARILDFSGSLPPVAIHHHLIEIGTISPTGKWFATCASGARGIELWDATTGKHARSLATESPVYGASFSPDDRWLAVDTASELVLFRNGSWSVGHRLVWDALEDQSTPRGGLSFSVDGALLAVHRAGYEIRLIRAIDGRVIATLPTEAPHAYVSFSPDGRYLTTIGPGLTIQRWDLALVRKQLRELGLDWR
jgi:WD40 repeat protein